MLKEIVDEVVTQLSQSDRFYGINCIASLPSTYTENPLRTNVITVGMENVEISSSGFGDLMNLNNGEFFVERAKLVKLTLRLTIHCGSRQNGTACYELFSDVIDELTCAKNFNFINFKGNDAVFNNRSSCFSMSILATLAVYMSTQPSSEFDAPILNDVIVDNI